MYAWKYVVDSDITGLPDDSEWYNGTDIGKACAKFLTGRRELNETEWKAFIDTQQSTYNCSRFIAEYDAEWRAMVSEL